MPFNLLISRHFITACWLWPVNVGRPRSAEEGVAFAKTGCGSLSRGVSSIPGVNLDVSIGVSKNDFLTAGLFSVTPVDTLFDTPTVTPSTSPETDSSCWACCLAAQRSSPSRNFLALFSTRALSLASPSGVITLLSAFLPIVIPQISNQGKPCCRSLQQVLYTP